MSLSRLSRYITILFFCALSAGADELLNIAVLDLEGRGISSDESLVLTDKLRAELFATGKYQVIERGAMEQILKEQGFQQSGCTSDECIVRMGQLIGVSDMVAGSIGKIEKTYFLSIRLIDVETGKIKNNVQYEITGTLTDVLKTGIRAVARKLAGMGKQETVLSPVPIAPLDTSTKPAVQETVPSAQPPAPMQPPVAVNQPEQDLNPQTPRKKRIYLNPAYGIIQWSKTLKGHSEYKFSLGLREYGIFWASAGYMRGSGDIVDADTTGLDYTTSYDVCSMGQEIRFPLLMSNKPLFCVDEAAIAARAGIHLLYCKGRRIDSIRTLVGFAAGAGADIYWLSIDFLYRYCGSNDDIFSGWGLSTGLKFYF
jgi:hypothetical protein